MASSGPIDSVAIDVVNQSYNGGPDRFVSVTQSQSLHQPATGSFDEDKGGNFR